MPVFAGFEWVHETVRVKINYYWTHDWRYESNAYANQWANC